MARAGFKTVALGKDRAEAIKKARAFNLKVYKWKGGQPVQASNRHGTLPWLIEQYKQSPEWAKLRPYTRDRLYSYHFRVLERWSAEMGDPPMRTIKKLDAINFWNRFNKETPAKAYGAVERARALWNFAAELSEDDPVVERNPWRLKVERLPPRHQVWQPEQIAAVVETALKPGPWLCASKYGPYEARPSVALAVIIASNIAQRPSDVFALRWSQYDGRYVTLTQQKTRATVIIPVTQELKIALADARKARGDVLRLTDPIIVNETTGRAWTIWSFQDVFRRVCQGAGVPDDMQFRDLRRTASTALAEAGCTLHEIAAIGGWTVDSVAKMMKTYAKANVTMADNAIVKFEQYRAKKAALEG